MSAKSAGMMFPKEANRKKRKAHKKSILQEKNGTCYLCIRLHGDFRIHRITHEHHIYDGPNRSISEAEGFKTYLCLEHHQYGPEAVHNNKENMRILQQDCQKEYERTHTREEFMRLIGRNFL